MTSAANTSVGDISVGDTSVGDPADQTDRLMAMAEGGEEPTT
jgi:hypothetical protein